NSFFQSNGFLLCNQEFTCLASPFAKRVKADKSSGLIVPLARLLVSKGKPWTIKEQKLTISNKSQSTFKVNAQKKKEESFFPLHRASSIGPAPSGQGQARPRKSL